MREWQQQRPDQQEHAAGHVQDVPHSGEVLPQAPVARSQLAQLVEDLPEHHHHEGVLGQAAGVLSVVVHAVGLEADEGHDQQGQQLGHALYEEHHCGGVARTGEDLVGGEAVELGVAELPGRLRLLRPAAAETGKKEGHTVVSTAAERARKHSGLLGHGVDAAPEQLVGDAGDLRQRQHKLMFALQTELYGAVV